MGQETDGGLRIYGGVRHALDQFAPFFVGDQVAFKIEKLQLFEAFEPIG